MTKLTYGIGFNSRRKHKTRINKKITGSYQAWSSMMERCYSTEYQKRNPTYIGCTVDVCFHDFQDFADWYESQEHKSLGYHLDKDLLILNNKVYSLDTCQLVPSEINTLLSDCSAARGVYPQGVCLHNQSGRYLANIRINGIKKSLGLFDCPNKAHQVYKEAKERHVKNKALEWANRIDWDVFVALMNWSLPDD